MSFSLSVGLFPRVLPVFGGTASTDTKNEAVEGDAPSTDPFLSLIHLHTQMLQQHYSTIDKTATYCFTEELNTLQKLPLQHFSLIASGSTFVVSSLEPFFNHGPSRLYGCNLSKAVVCKRLRRVDGPDVVALMKKRLEAAVNEVLALTYPTLREHENIADLMSLWWENNPSEGHPLPILIMERAEFGTLADLQRCPLTLRFATKLRLCLDVALGLEAVHEASIIHSDLKNENVLVFGHPERGYVGKLCDFGSTTEGGHLVNMFGDMTTVLTVEDALHPIQLPVVTFPWNAPEYNSRVNNIDLRHMDIYSLGLLVWRTMLDGENPFTLLGFSGDSEETRQTIEKMKKSGSVHERARESLLLQLECMIIAGDLILDTIFDVLDCTLQLSPEKRSLDKAIKRMGGKPSSHNLMRGQGEIVDFSNFKRMRTSYRNLTRTWDGSPLLITPREDTVAASYAAKKLYEAIWESSDILEWSSLLIMSVGGMFPEGNIDIETVLMEFGKTLPRISPVDDLSTRYDYFERRLIDNITILYIQMLAALGQKEKSMSTSVMSNTLRDIAMRECSSICSTTLRDSIELIVEEATRSSRSKYAGIGLDLRQEIPSELQDLTRLEGWIQSALLRNPISDPDIQDLALERDSKNVNSLYAIRSPRHNVLHVAAMYGYNEVTSLLLEKFGFNADYPNFIAQSALHLAMRSGHHDIARMLIQHSANVTKRDGCRSTPVHWVSNLDKDQIEPMLDLFIEAGADINAISGVDLDADLSDSDDDDASSLPDSMISASSSEEGVSWDEIFMNFSPRGSSLHVAVSQNNTAAVQALCSRGADVKIKAKVLEMDLDPLQLAILLHLSDLAAIMLPHYPQNDLTRFGTFLGLAISTQITGQRMQIHGAEFLQSTERTIKWCIEQVPCEIWNEELSLPALVSISNYISIKTLFDLGIFSSRLEDRIPYRGYQLTSLQIALSLGKHELFRLLLERGADINAVLDDNSTSNCLHLCAFRGLVDKVIIDTILSRIEPTLLEAKGDCFTSYQTPLMLSLQQGNFTLASILIAHGASIEATAPCQFTANILTPMTVLGHLSRQGFETSLAQLMFLLSGKDLFVKPSFIVAPAVGFTALHAAVLCPQDRHNFSGTSLILEYLLSVYHKDDQINQTDAFGCTALHLATIFEFQEAVQLLLSHGVDARIRDREGNGFTALQYANINHSLSYLDPVRDDLENGQSFVNQRINRTRIIVDLLQSHEDNNFSDIDLPASTTQTFEEPVYEKTADFIQYIIDYGSGYIKAGENVANVARNLDPVVNRYISDSCQTNMRADNTSDDTSVVPAQLSTAYSTCIPTWFLFVGRREMPLIRFQALDQAGKPYLSHFEIYFEITSNQELSTPRSWVVVTSGQVVPADTTRPITQRVLEIMGQNLTTISQLAELTGALETGEEGEWETEEEEDE